MALCIKNGTVLVGQEFAARDIYIDNGVIAKIGSNLSPQGAEVLDAAGLFVLPGFIDMHVHLREPGFGGKETIETGCRAAAAGGFTGVACMPNTNPVADNPTVLAYIREKANKANLCRVYPVAAITKGQKGEELAEMGLLQQEGAVAFSDDGFPVKSNRLMRLAMEYCKGLDGLLISHCEDELADGGDMHEGSVSAALGLKGIPSESEAIMAARDMLLAGMLGARLHLAHVSAGVTLRLLREAKAAGVPVTAETCPHYFAADHTFVKNYNTLAKVNPPLRTSEDRQAIMEAITDGTIDVLATDHAPHTEADKACEFSFAANGISGLETAFALNYTYLVEPGHITLERLAALMSTNPARLLGVPGGSLAEGQPADITVVNTNREHTITPSQFFSKGKNTPFAGMQVKGKVEATIVGGRILYKNGSIV